MEIWCVMQGVEFGARFRGFWFRILGDFSLSIRVQVGWPLACVFFNAAGRRQRSHPRRPHGTGKAANTCCSMKVGRPQLMDRSLNNLLWHFLVSTSSGRAMWQVAYRGCQPSTKAIVVSDLHGGLRRLREGLQWPVFKGLQWLEPPATYAHGNDEGVHQASVN